MKFKNKKTQVVADEVKPVAAGSFRMRLPAGKFAVSAVEAEVRLDGARIAGGNGTFEFDLPIESWVEIEVIRA